MAVSVYLSEGSSAFLREGAPASEREAQAQQPCACPSACALCPSQRHPQVSCVVPLERTSSAVSGLQHSSAFSFSCAFGAEGHADEQCAHSPQQPVLPFFLRIAQPTATPTTTSTHNTITTTSIAVIVIICLPFYRRSSRLPREVAPHLRLADLRPPFLPPRVRLSCHACG